MTGFKIMFVLIGILIAAFHVGSVVLKKKIAEILTYVNIVLHIALIFVLMALEVSFEFMALSFMVSLLVYLSAAYFFYKIRVRRARHSDV